MSTIATTDRPRSRFLFRPPKCGGIGIDVGAHSVKVAAVERDARGWRVRFADRLRVGSEGEPEPPFRQVLDNLGPLLAEWRERTPSLPTRRCACVFSGNELDLREFDPGGADAGTIEERATASFGPSLATLAWDAWTEDVPGGASVGQIAAVRNDDALALVNGACRAGLDSEILDIAPFVAARAARLAGGETGSVLVIDWGRSRVALTWVIDGAPRFFRCAGQCGAELLTSAAASALGVSEADAEVLLEEFGAGGDRDEASAEIVRAIREAVSEPISFLADEVEKTLSYLKVRRREAAVERCLLIGGGSAVRGIPRWLTEELELTTTAWELLRAGDAAPARRLGPFAQAIALSALASQT